MGCICAVQPGLLATESPASLMRDLASWLREDSDLPESETQMFEGAISKALQALETSHSNVRGLNSVRPTLGALSAWERELADVMGYQ
jgi:hypothetical protein